MMTDDEQAIREDERERLSARVYELGWCPTCARNADPADIAAAIMVDPAEVLSPEELAEYERCQQSVIDARRRAPMVEGQIVVGAASPAAERNAVVLVAEQLQDALREAQEGFRLWSEYAGYRGSRFPVSRHAYKQLATQITEKQDAVAAALAAASGVLKETT